MLRQVSWARAREARQPGAAIALGAVLFLVAWGILHVRPFDLRQIVDTPVYQQYGDAVLAGDVPYRDFSIEYPPGALPAFIIPSFAPAADYRTAFELLMLLCGLGTVALVGRTLFALGASPARLYAGTALPAVATGLLGSVALTRFDYWPAFLTAAALAAVVSGHERVGFAALGAAIAAKIYPAVLLPVLLVEVWRSRGRRSALTALAACGAAIAVFFLPFAILSPHGLGESFHRQLGRPLQIESIGSALLLAAHQVGVYDPVVVSSNGSQNLSGSAPHALATVTTVVQILAVLCAWALVAFGRAGRRDTLAGCALAVTTFIAFGKVLSPQYLLWLVPLVPLLAGRIGRAAGITFLACCALTQLWFPQLYWRLVGLEAIPTALLVVRDLALVGLVAILAVATARPREPSRIG